MGLLQSAAFGQGSSNSAANNAIRIAVVGLGGIDTICGLGGRDRQLIETLRKVPGMAVYRLADHKGFRCSHVNDVKLTSCLATWLG